MSKECLAQEANFAKFVENCADIIYPVDSTDNRYLKSLFIRICAGQQDLKKLFFQGHEKQLFKAASIGETIFFSEVIALTKKIPRALGFLLLKFYFFLVLFKSVIYGSNKNAAEKIEKINNKILLVSNLKRLTLRFAEVIDCYDYILEVSVNGKVQIINKNHSKSFSFFLPRLSIRQFFLILSSPVWQTSYLIRALRLKNLIDRFNFKEIYIMDGDAPSHVSAAYAAKLSSIPSIGIQWGGMLMGVKPGYKLFPFDHFFCTGPFYIDQLSPFSKNTNFSVCSPKYKNNDIYEKPTNQDRNQSLLFLLNSGTVISKQESDGLIELCLNTKRRFPDLNVTARPHPRMDLDSNVISNLTSAGITVDNSQSPASALMSHKILIGHVSSMMIECLEYDCFPVFYDIGLDELFPDIVKLSAARIIKNEEEWFNLLDDMLSNYDEYVVSSNLKLSLFGHA